MDVSRMIRIAVTIATVGVVTALIVSQFDTPGYDVAPSSPMGGMTGMAGMGDGVAKPDLEGLALEGKALFQASCAACTVLTNAIILCASSNLTWGCGGMLPNLR